MEADDLPGPTMAMKEPALDILLPGGSIVWSEGHDNVFTPERTRQETLDFAAYKIENPPIVDPKGVEHIETLLEYLHRKGVRVYLAHPPYNPLFWETVQGTAYMDGLKPVTDLVQGWADRFGWDVIGSFNGNDYGCTIDQYIDSEHADRECLKGIFDQFVALDRAKEGLPPLGEVPLAPMPAPGSMGDEALIASARSDPGQAFAASVIQTSFGSAGPSPDRIAEVTARGVAVDAAAAREVGLASAEASALLASPVLRGLYD